MLIHLSEGKIGGQVLFPRWANAETFNELVVPEVLGNAVLYYSQLPDGNMDELAEQGTKIPRDGDKWLLKLIFQPRTSVQTA